MHRKDLFALAGWFMISLVPLVVHAQDGTDKPYLPLALGNEWTYYHLQERLNGSIDTLIHDPLRITESFDLEGQTYYRYPQTLFFGLDTLRTDEEGRVFAWHNEEELLLFDFTLPDSAVYTFSDPRFAADEPYDVTVTRKVTLDILGGRFLDAIEFFFDMPRTLDEAQSYTFYPGVGLIRHVGGMGQFILLCEAVVDGQIVTEVEERPVRQAFEIETAFPNPFRDTTTLRFTPERPGHSTLKIYDVLGREVVTLVDGFVEAAPKQVAWDGRGQPSGLYIARLQMGGTIQSAVLILTR